MSGIAVIHNLDGRPAQPRLLSSMLDAVAHRAINGRGTWIAGATAMGHAQVWTTPESVHELQPLVFESGEGPLCLVLDGRVDNRRALRSALLAIGAKLVDDTDAELILRAWQCWGEQSIGKIIGDFAYVIWDGRQRKLFCARDICGIRPLFYYFDEHTLFCGSELQQLVALPQVLREPNPPVIAEYMCATLTSPSETLFRDIRRLLPAHYLVAGTRGVTTRRYYDLDGSRTIRYGTDRQYGEHFLDVFKEAVRCRLRSHAPVAAELSGGLDSSSVVATIKGLEVEGYHPPAALECFSIVYNEPECDERGYAEEVASATAFKCNFIRPALLDYRKCVEQVRRYSDLPDYVNGAVFDGLREELVRRGSRVVLTGLGGDQWLQGSEYYLCDLIAGFHWCEVYRQLNCDQRFGTLTTPREKLGVLLRWGVKPMMPKVAIRLLKRIMGRPLYLDAIRAPFARAVRLAERLDDESPRPPNLTYGQRSIYNNWVSPWMIHAFEMDDRSNAWAGIEGRHPFYDRRVLEFAFAIPEEQRARLDLTKFVLRTAMKGLLPEGVRQRRTKGRLGRIFVQTFEKLGGEYLFDKMAMESNGWIDAGRMRQICAERLNSARPFDLWPLWTTFAVDLWYREVFGNSTGAGSWRLKSAPGREVCIGATAL